MYLFVFVVPFDTISIVAGSVGEVLEIFMLKKISFIHDICKEY